jgi:oligopeptidase A
LTESPNPLLEIRFEIPFDQVRPEHVEPAIEILLAQARESVDRIAALSDVRTYENTMHALEMSTERLDYAMTVVRHLESVETSPELRAVFNAVQPAVSAFYSSIPLNEQLWNALKVFSETEEAKHLTGVRNRLLTKTLDSFRRHGAQLDPDGKKRLAAIDVELTRITTKFGENTLDSTNAWDLVIEDQAQLAGLPPSAVAAARESAAQKGREGWRFTLQAPSYIALLTYLDDRGIRERAYRAFQSRAAEPPYENRDLVRRILELRAEKARLLGYANFADLVLEERMAHTGAHALAFLRDMEQKTVAGFERENQELRAFAAPHLAGDPGGRDLAAWDVAYFAEKQRQALYDFDEEALRPYFPADRVVAGMFDIVERLYGIRVVQRTGPPVWHPDVKVYEVIDRDGVRLGSFYADWFPRETKRGGAWMDAFITGEPIPNSGAICGNLTPPLGTLPALLTHREVETIFHEFGHLLHHTLSRVGVKSLAGTNVAWDFVELPSQIMENWCWERDALDLFARHWETQSAIPEDLFLKMRRARNFRSANTQMRQLGFAITDLLLHTEYSPERDGDVVDYSRALLQRFSSAPLPPDHASICSFTHLFGSPVGYGAGYYSYKWAEVLEADAFTRFRKEGIFSPAVGGEFRDKILSQGDSRDPAELYRDFMGRDPDPDALLIRSGLLTNPVENEAVVV